MRRLLLSFALLAGSVAWLGVDAGPAAAEPEAVACTVFGVVTFAPALAPVPVPTALGGGLTLTCAGVGDDVGVWTLFPAGVVTASCVAGSGAGVWVAPSGGPEGPVAPPGWTYAHTPFMMTFVGTAITGPPAESHTVVIEIPAPAACGAGVVAGTGVAVVSD